MSRPGLTILETLAVVTLLAVATALLATGAAAPIGAARLGEAAALVGEADRRARLYARAWNAPAQIAFDPEHRRLTVRAAGVDGLVLDRAVPNGVRIDLISDGPATPGTAVRVDRRGRGRDYHAVIVGGERRIGVRVSGLTGWTERTPGGEIP